MKTTFYNVLIFLSYAILSGSGLLILKIAVSEKPFNLGNILSLLGPKFFIGFTFYACGFLVWLLILSKFKLSVAFPVSVSLFFIVIILGSYYVLKEQFSFLQGIGILLCFLGILFISAK